jgi:hypothetical protein
MLHRGVCCMHPGRIPRFRNHSDANSDYCLMALLYSSRNMINAIRNKRHSLHGVACEPIGCGRSHSCQAMILPIRGHGILSITVRSNLTHGVYCNCRVNSRLPPIPDTGLSCTSASGHTPAVCPSRDCLGERGGTRICHDKISPSERTHQAASAGRGCTP